MRSISLVNIDAKNAQEISVDLRGNKPTSLRENIKFAKLQDYNSFENADKIKPASFSGASLSGNSLKVKAPPFSRSAEVSNAKTRGRRDAEYS
jgi:alpha-N-arabinofuranosidase